MREPVASTGTSAGTPRKKRRMQALSLDQAADLLATATLDSTQDHVHTIVHTGTDAAGNRFTLMNDCHGQSCVSYQL